MSYLSYQINNNIVKIKTNLGFIEISSMQKDMFHIDHKAKETDKKEVSFSKYKDFKQLNLEVFETDTSLEVSNGNLKCILNKKSDHLEFTDSKNVVISKQKDVLLDQKSVFRPIIDANDSTTIETADGIKEVVVEKGKKYYKELYSSIINFDFDNDEKIYGLGQHEEGYFNYRGRKQYLYQENMKIAVPFFVSSKKYAYFFDTASFSIFNDNENGSYFYSDKVPYIAYDFFNCNTYDEIIHLYRKLTGKASMLPLSAFGYVQSKERYTSQDELLSIAKTFRDNDIPIDILVQDWRYWKEGYWSQKSFDFSRFEDPKELTSSLHNSNIDLMISIWPAMRGNCPDQIELKEANGLLADQCTYDPTNKTAKDLYWKQAKEGLYDYGVDYWWCDCSEPFGNDWHGYITPDKSIQACNNKNELEKFLLPEMLNSYTYYHAKTIYEGQRSVTNKRVLNLTRSYFPGQQSFGAIAWSGDICATYDCLKKQIAEGLSFAISGASYWTLDIGAFFVKNDPAKWFWTGDYDKGINDLGYVELYTRWLQLGAFLPMMRSHGTDFPREPWQFKNEKDMRFYESIISFINLRYTLLPYIYAQAANEHFNDKPMMRPLFFDFWEDTKTHNIKNQFMFGPSLLVCPITEPMYYGINNTTLDTSKEVDVYLPKGNNWYDYFTKEYYQGGQTIKYRANIETIPLFVKEGSILPISESNIQSSKDYSGDSYTLKIYKGKDCNIDLYEDDHNTYDYEDGIYSVINISYCDETNKLTIKSKNGSNYNIDKEVTFVVKNHNDEEITKFVFKRKDLEITLN